MQPLGEAPSGGASPSGEGSSLATANNAAEHARAEAVEARISVVDRVIGCSRDQSSGDGGFMGSSGPLDPGDAYSRLRE